MTGRHAICPVSHPAENSEEAFWGAPRLRIPSRQPPERFPGAVGWFKAARTDALGLFPKPCFESARVDTKFTIASLSVVSDPASIVEIFATRSDEFELANIHLRLLKPSLGAGLIVAQGDDWRRLRRASLGAIRRASRVSNDSAAYGAARELAVGSGQAPDFPSQLARLVLDLVATQILGHEKAIASEPITAAIEHHRQISEKVDLFDVLGVNPHVPSFKMRKAARIAAKFDAAILDEIRSSQLQPSRDVKPDEYRDLVVNLLTGFESLWLTCLWSMLTIANYPELGKWLREAGDHKGFEARLERLAQEILRLYPPLPLIYRKPLRDVSLASGDYAKGQLICVSPYVVHRHAELWDEPNVLALDRPREAYRGTTYMPFGVGARRCVGASVSLPLVVKILGGLLADHNPISVSAMPVPRMGLSLRPNGAYDLNLVRV